MATARRTEANGDEVPAPRAMTATIRDRIAAFTMLDGMKDATQAQKCVRLSLSGFSNGDIATMLQTTPAVVSQNLYETRKRAAKKVPAKAVAKGVAAADG
jgi:hypothetical protein